MEDEDWKLHGQFDAQGFALAFYSELTHGARLLPDGEVNPDCKIPEDAIPVSDEIWKAMISDRARARYIEGEVIYVDLEIDVDLHRGFAKTRIDAAAEESRLRYITGGAGQAMTYQQKAYEAGLCLADSSPDAAKYPMLAAEIGVTAPDLVGVATIVYAAFSQWLTIGAAIESIRLGAKAQIDAAGTVAEIDAIVTSAVFP